MPKPRLADHSEQINSSGPPSSSGSPNAAASPNTMANPHYTVALQAAMALMPNDAPQPGVIPPTIPLGSNGFVTASMTPFAIPPIFSGGFAPGAGIQVTQFFTPSLQGVAPMMTPSIPSEANPPAVIPLATESPDSTKKGPFVPVSEEEPEKMRSRVRARAFAKVPANTSTKKVVNIPGETVVKAPAITPANAITRGPRKIKGRIPRKVLATRPAPLIPEEEPEEAPERAAVPVPAKARAKELATTPLEKPKVCDPRADGLQEQRTEALGFSVASQEPAKEKTCRKRTLSETLDVKEDVDTPRDVTVKKHRRIVSTTGEAAELNIAKAPDSAAVTQSPKASVPAKSEHTFGNSEEKSKPATKQPTVIISEPTWPRLPDAINDADDNHLTRFNELCQKGIADLRVPKYSYEIACDEVGGPMMWKCTATTEARHPNTGEIFALETTALGKTKKDSKRRTAKTLLNELSRTGVLDREPPDTKGTQISQPTPEPVEAQDQSESPPRPEIAGAVSILNQLWQKEKFPCKPKWSVVPVSAGPVGRWRCDLLVHTAEYGEIEASETSSQKKVCRQLAAYRVVQKLRELNFEALEVINIHSRIPSSIHSEPSPTSSDEEDSFNSEADSSEFKATKTSARGTGDDAAGDVAETSTGAELEIGRLFTLPQGFEIVVAETDKDCNLWVANNATDGCELGVYIDSPDLRVAFQGSQDGQESKTPKQSIRGIDECKVICISTDRSALLASAHHLAKKTGAPHGGGATLWIPNIVRLLLGRREYMKYGCQVGEGALLLKAFYGVSCSSVHDLGIASTAVRGFSMSQRRVLSSPPELVTQWLSQRLEPFAERTYKDFPVVSKLIEDTDDMVAPAVVTALASYMIEQRITRIAEAHRRKRCTNTDEYNELCNRLCMAP